MLVVFSVCLHTISKRFRGMLDIFEVEAAYSRIWKIPHHVVGLDLGWFLPVPLLGVDEYTNLFACRCLDLVVETRRRNIDVCFANGERPRCNVIMHGSRHSRFRKLDAFLPQGIISLRMQIAPLAIGQPGPTEMQKFSKVYQFANNYRSK